MPLYSDHLEPNKEGIKASLIRALQDVKEGRVRPLSELWDRIDPTPSMTNNTIGITNMDIKLTLEEQESLEEQETQVDPTNPYNVDPLLLEEVWSTINNLYKDTCTQLGIDPTDLKEGHTANLKRILCILNHSLKVLGTDYPCNATE